MKYTMDSLLKEKIFYYFSEISKIPRESGNEKQISDYLRDFALKRGLFVNQDKFLNIIIKKPATLGYENAPAVIIQGHMDMVCEKNEGTIHDFSKDPLNLMIDGDILYADGTTLGADNGIAVAFALALLDSNDLPHPSLEVIITTDEEVGLTGALSMDVSNLEGKYYINMDSEEEGEIVVSCAGGLRALLELPIEYTSFNKNDFTAFQISIKGLKGGHSGMEIDKNRGNSIKLIGIVLSSLIKDIDINVSHVYGGMKDNVIPRESFATLYIPKHKVNLFNEKISAIFKELKEEYSTTEPELIFNLEEIENPIAEKVFSQESLDNIIFLLMTLPNGVQTMSADIKDLVESSINLGRLYLNNNNLCFEFAARSSAKSKKYRMIEILKLYAKKVNGRCIESKDYPEWPFKKDSKFLDLCIDVFEKLYNKKPIIKGIHAGLESGVFIEKLPHLEAVSFGPNIFDVHSPDERISISSVQRTWDYLKEILKSIK